MSKRLLIILLIIPFFVNAQVVSDAKLWTGISVSKEFKDFEFSLSKELRFDENISHIDKSFLEIGAAYKIRKGLYAAFNYRFNRDNDYSDESYDLIQRIDFGLSYKKKINKFRLGFRTKLQLKSASPEDNNPFVSRNKLSLKYKLNKKVSPYVAYEFYYQFNNENIINRTRTALGSSYKINEKSALKLFYMFENRFNVKNLKHNHVYGISYSIEL
jgi:hypothetical protein